MARNPYRIRSIMNRLTNIWAANPDLRLGQLLINALPDNAFYLEDEEFISELEGFYRETERARTIWRMKDMRVSKVRRLYLFYHNRRCSLPRLLLTQVLIYLGGRCHKTAFELDYDAAWRHYILSKDWRP